MTATATAAQRLTDLPRAKWIGQRVTPDPDFEGLPASSLGIAYKVDRVARVNVIAKPESGTGRGVRFPAESYLILADGENPVRSLLRPFVAREMFTPGEIVTLKRAWRDWAATTPLVVLKDDGGDKINVTLLGGAGDTHLRINKSGVVKRDLAWLTEALVDAA